MTDRVWADISSEAIISNYQTIKKLAAPAELIPVVKSNAYGHGAVCVVPLLELEGARRFAVATPEEALELRRAGVRSDILVLGWVSPTDAGEMLEHNVTLTAVSAAHASSLAYAVRGLGRRLKIHLAVDTGMSRLGFVTEQERIERSVEEIETAASSEGLYAEGIFTHFATSELPDDPFVPEQISRFRAVLDALAARGVNFEVVHSSNSGAILNVPDARFNAVRPGIILYGIYPDGRTGRGGELLPVMSLRSRLVQIHEYENPVTVSYGRHFRTSGFSRIGTVSIGYADGLHRALSGRMDMLVRGRRAPQIGSICMDMCMIDLSNVPQAREGDVVTVFGADGDEFTGVSELAGLAGTIPYELTCALSRRVRLRVVPHE